MAIALAVTLALPAIARRMAIAEARARGVTLEAFEIALDRSGVRVRDARFTLAGVRGVLGSFDEAAIELDGLAPKQIAIGALDVTVEGTHFAADLARWAAEPNRTAPLPVHVDAARVAWRETAVERWAVVIEGGASFDGGAGALRAKRIQVAGHAVGGADIAFRIAPKAFAAGLGAATVEAAPLRVEVLPDPAPGRLRASLRATPAPSVASALGVALALAGVTAEAEIEVSMPQQGGQGEPIEGTFSLGLAGYVPPHPRELDGIVFGDRTQASGRLRLTSDRQRVELPELHVRAGALSLDGNGHVDREDREGGGARVRMDLSGSVPCSALATSVAAAQLGSTLGGLAGKLARRTLAGSVAVRLAVEMDTRNPNAARVSPSAVVRCEVRL